MQPRCIALLALLTGCDALFGLSSVTFVPPGDAGPDAMPDAAPCERIGYPGLPISETGGGPFVHALGDLNRDGKLDVVVPNLYDNTLGVLIGNGDGTYLQQRTFPTGANPRAIAIADLDGDMNPDVVVANQGAATIAIYLGTGTGDLGSATPHNVGVTPVAVSVGDLDGNGTLDLVVPNYTSGTVSVLVGNGSGGFTLAPTPTACANVYATAWQARLRDRRCAR